MATVELGLLSIGGRPPPEPLTCTIGETGGKIGRAEHNDMVLPGADKLVSRVHARVAWRKDGPVIVACGANPLLVDGMEIKRGEEETIRRETLISIGSHEILAVASDAKDPDATTVLRSGETTIDYRGKLERWES